MKKIVCLIIALFTLHPAFSQQNEGKVIERSVYSHILGTEKSYSVYLPAGYDDLPKSYPVLYLLHGAWGCYTDWVKHGNAAFIADKAIRGGTALPMIIVMPDARGEKDNLAGRHMGYFNYRNWRYHDFFIKEFIPAVEAEYRIKKDKYHRAIAGLSMGADGSVYIAQAFSGYFGSVCALSGGFLTLGAVLNEDVDTLYFDEMEKVDPVRHLQLADDRQLEELKSIRWYVDCGDDDYLIKGSLLLFQAMRGKEIPTEFRVRDGGHTWDYWQSGLANILQYVSIGFFAEPP